MNNVKYFVVTALFLLSGCGPKKEAANLGKDLIGEWRNVYLKVTLNASGNGDSVRVTQCDSTNWEQMLGIKPIHTFFNTDGSYQSQYYTLKDSLFMTNTGTWRILGDTLIMEQMTPKASVYKLKTSVNGIHATFEGMIDFDNDQKSDDHYIGKQRKQ